jgi:copper chaperone CopZ
MFLSAQRRAPVKTVTIEIPNLFGDHHVIEIRKILLSLPGVQDVYASSAFRVVEITYDPNITNDLELSIKLDEAGYLGEWSIPVESGDAAYQQDSAKPFFRHTAVYENMQHVVSFAQNTVSASRPLWNCPGMGVIKSMEE